ncbi:ribosome maturation factor RimM [Intrasporangium oryzae NRRL B-24470]|uniref:Ribosome maturation factor RimM n=1 Tax=Intrasporangium oryzae NRRL B-24470 TaxID=1386089 RepID=W9G9N8_9MICO|nr:ribosome maturation factor RimM [Intrasporangium oryzae]EWT01518.1 ribosome maturation factor RimM [Intrasporangium oryzae NRRL B-24470]
MSVVLARIGKPHGLRGEVTVQLHTDEPERRFALGTALDTEAAPGSGVPRRLTVRSTRVHNGTWLIAFEEVPDRTGAEGLRGTRLVIDEEAIEPDEDEYYEDDLVGLEVRDPSGAVLGTVTGLEVGTAQDRLVLELADGVTAYVPFVEQIVPVVADDHVVVDAPPGLFDLYREGGE